MSAPTTAQVLENAARTASARQAHITHLDYDPNCAGCTYDGHRDDFAPAHTCGQTGGAR